MADDQAFLFAFLQRHASTLSFREAYRLARIAGQTHKEALYCTRSSRIYRETVGANLEWLGIPSSPPEDTFTGSYDSQGLPIHI